MLQPAQDEDIVPADRQMARPERRRFIVRSFKGDAMSIARKIYFRVLFMIAAGGLASSASAEGINCAKAQTPNEKAICADPDLRALDTRVATVYSRLMKELDPESVKALKSDQRWFNTAQELATKVRGGRVEKEDLSDSLQFRAKFLESIIAHPAPGLSGRWENVEGTITLEETPEKRVAFDGTAADAQSQRWTCEAAGDGPVANGEAKIAIDTDDGAWTITAARNGATLGLEEAPPSGYSGSPSYCGFNGRFSGVYFQTTK
ncbi:DUF1311 domain-containing protein (plasmid) [Rhizobium sp. NIBRBAC000502774]|nr:DUF1311 domain-containing protein [Rhizobium sp. NIBRBAC000502774]